MSARETLARELTAARARTLRLVDLDDAELVRQYHPLMSPLVWDLAHIGQQEELWLLRDGDPDRPGLLAPEVERLYDAFVHPRKVRGQLPLLSPTEARAFCRTVRDRVLDRLDRLPDDDPGFTYAMVVSHEQQHDETMLQALNLREGPPLLDRGAPLPPGRPELAGQSVLIPGGEFVLGANGRPDAPPHIVSLPEFYIDQHEVTNASYAQCVAENACTPQESASSETHPNYASQEAYANFPVMHVSWEQANQFCQWAGKRLPTEAEWEKAASWNAESRTKSTWPFGEVFDPALLNSIESNAGDTTAVDAHAPELNGTYDMAGNVAEWTSSLYRPYPYDPSDGREDASAEGDRVYRGGSWAQSQGKALSAVRNHTSPSFADREIGFRCAATP